MSKPFQVFKTYLLMFPHQAKKKQLTLSPDDQPRNITTSSRVSTRTPDQRKPSRRLRDASASCVEATNEDNCFGNINLGDQSTYKAAINTKHAKASQNAVDVDTLRNNCTMITVQQPVYARLLHAKGSSRQTSTRTAVSYVSMSS
jgi:hypothetical protein